MPHNADKPDGIHDWNPPHLRQDTPAVRAANKASSTPVAEEAEEALAESVKDAKAELREIQKGKKK